MRHSHPTHSHPSLLCGPCPRLFSQSISSFPAIQTSACSFPVILPVIAPVSSGYCPFNTQTNVRSPLPLAAVVSPAACLTPARDLNADTGQSSGLPGSQQRYPVPYDIPCSVTYVPPAPRPPPAPPPPDRLPRLPRHLPPIPLARPRTQLPSACRASTHVSASACVAFTCM